MATKDIVDTARDAGFKTLHTALEKAGLVQTLRGPGPFTVFAPSEEAFAKLPKQEFDVLLQNPEKLKQVLLFHVVPGKIRSSDVTKMQDGSKIRTSANKDFTLGLKEQKVTINDAAVTKTDIEASNGCIHVIDRVIMPK